MANLALQAREDIAVSHPVLSPERWPDAEALIAAACERTGLADFGPLPFREGLETLLQSLRDESQIEGTPRINVLALLLHRLENRLQVEAWHSAHPAASDAAVPSPIAITGLPRTGTTALGNLMSLDTLLRPLRSWEQADPVPPPVTATELNDPRRLSMRARIEAMVAADPDIMATHLYDTDATEEDHDVLGMAFAAQHNTWPVPEYRDWWRAADMQPAYAWHRRVLQLLQSSRPPDRWILKGPHYKFHMDAIARVYPDVKFVFTHRDPAKAIPSYFSFVMNYYPAGAVERHGAPAIADDIYRHLLAGMKTAVAARERLGEAHFIDVSQRQLGRDPLGTLERVYDALDLPFTPRLADDVSEWHAANHSGAHGSHRYSAEDFGFSPARITSDFDFYTERYGSLC